MSKVLLSGFTSPSRPGAGTGSPKAADVVVPPASASDVGLEAVVGDGGAAVAASVGEGVGSADPPQAAMTRLATVSTATAWSLRAFITSVERTTGLRNPSCKGT